MDLASLVKDFSTTPFLFVGSGFSRRYYGLPDWTGLLQVFVHRMSQDEFAFSKYLSLADETINSGTAGIRLAVAAELIKQDFDKRWFEDPDFRKASDPYKEFVKKGQSPFKVELAEYIDQHSVPVEAMRDELAKLKKLSCRSLAGIITTNYDRLLESEMEDYKTFVGQEELVFSALQGWAEIYKIHGSVTNPDSIIITSKDYNEFKEYSPYLAAKLMTIFMEYPIIFIGYSINDPNIRIILEELGKCLSKENLQKLQRRFIYVEHKAGQQHIEFFEHSVVIQDDYIHMTGIRTDNFMAIYDALSEKRASLPAKFIRMFKQEFYNFALTNEPNARIRVANIDDDRIKDEDLMIAIGKPSEFGVRGLSGMETKEWYQHVILHDLEFSADDILTYAFPALQRTNIVLPLNMLLNEANKPYPDCEAKRCASFDSMLNSNYRKGRNRVIAARSINGIIHNHNNNTHNILYEIPYLQEQEIDINELEAYLRELYSQNDLYDRLDSHEKSNLHRVVRIFDYLKYGRP
ncbi:MAG: SIR2 family protein [Desulfovibrio sp.]|uniref:SIR2 family protein n=1 Tax=Desulfovibrio sp. TaxID=885 RepID=UPI002A35CD16|nr:SIR2 family protein [Desulfovibrio sp.]MDY0260217.1 SIR2 family protein [Desulfovibrio sp.]